MDIARAQDDAVDFLGCAVDEVRNIAFDFGQQRALFELFRPVERQRIGAIAESHRVGTVLDALRPDIFGGIGAADHQHVLAGEFIGRTEIVRMHDPAGKRLDSFEFGHVGRGEMARRDDHVIERFLIGFIGDLILDPHREQAGLRIPRHPADRAVETHERAHPGLFDPAHDIVMQHGARRIRRDRATEMFLKGIVGEFEAFLGPVGPQIAIHRAMDRLAKLIEPGAPGIFPQAAPIFLLFKADHFGNVDPLGLGTLKRPQHGKSARAGTNHCNSLGHECLPSPGKVFAPLQNRRHENPR